MRILYASERPPYPFFLGGAARCAHMLLLAMSRDPTTSCLAVGSSDYAVTPWSYPAQADYGALGIQGLCPSPLAPPPLAGEGNPALDCGYPVRVLPDFFNALGPFIDSYKPDVVWAQLEGARKVLEIARRKGVKGLYYVHDAEFDSAELRAIADLGCHIVCSSGFLAGKAGKAIGRRAHVVYPASDWYFGTRPDTAGCVTMINPHKVKGLGTFLEIAGRMPSQRFLLVESWKLGEDALAALWTRLETLPNVRFQPRVSDMREIYGQTRLLLAPSVWEEGFGMVSVEAQSCGIPVIASARGGLPESVGDGGLLIADYRSPDAWLEAIGRVLGDDALYRSLAAHALEHARSPDFVPAELARRFLAVCAAPAPDTGVVAKAGRGLRRYVAQLLR
jgi:glycosyltransferase involved in cell wall biosynthesis